MKIEFVNAEYQSDRLGKSIFSIMETTKLWSMATADPKGESHINTAFFCYNNILELYFLSDISTKHCQNLEKNPEAAVAIYSTDQEPGSCKLRGLQLFGQCSLTKGKENAKASLCYAKRFFSFKKFLKTAGRKDIKEFTSIYKLYVFRPKEIKVFDEPEFGEETFVSVQVIRDLKV